MLNQYNQGRASQGVHYDVTEYVAANAASACPWQTKVPISSEQEYEHNAHANIWARADLSLKDRNMSQLTANLDTEV